MTLATKPRHCHHPFGERTEFRARDGLFERCLKCKAKRRLHPEGWGPWERESDRRPRHGVQVPYTEPRDVARWERAAQERGVSLGELARQGLEAACAKEGS